MRPWYETLDESDREKLFDLMRSMDLDSLEDEKRYRELSPGLCEIAVGARHFDSWIRYYAVQEFLSALRTSSSVSEAREVACCEVRFAIKTHNDKRPRDIHWHRAPGHVDAHIDWLVEQIESAVHGGPVVT